MEKVASFIVDWLDEYARRAGVKGFVVGVSGGIDSAVTSTLCALTGKTVYVVNMPIHQARSQVARATAHIDWLCRQYKNVRAIHTDLTSVFDQFGAVMPTTKNQGLSDLTAANTRARLRMTTLYHIAGINRCLVAGTGNKVEDFGVGFFTKYGDGGVDISPIADLVKSAVFALGRCLGVCDAILNAAPTDGLFGDDRTDEMQIGASYDELEWAMQHDPKDTNLNERQQEVLKIYQHFHLKNQHKMKPIPVCLIPKNLKTK